MSDLPCVFLLAGKTGGPLVPLLAIAANIQANPLIIGVENGVETDMAAAHNISIEYVPEAKFALSSFSNQSNNDKIRGIFGLITTLFLLIGSTIKCWYLLAKYRPIAILSAGSFINIPMTYAMRITNALGRTHTKLIIHQQDPVPGLANTLVVSHAALVTCVFGVTREYRGFEQAHLIPNPMDIERFEQKNLTQVYRALKTSDEKLYAWITTEKNKPVLMIFGGGSGARAINDWVWHNLDELLVHFCVLHVTGALQDTRKPTTRSGYYAVPFLQAEYALCLVMSDVVLCRAGLGSISELQYLEKKAVLVPIKHSHQEKNAAQVADSFVVADQENTADWMSLLVHLERTKHVSTTDSSDYGDRLQEYYAHIQTLISPSEA